MLIKVSDLQCGSMPLDFTESFNIPDVYSVSGDITVHIKGYIVKGEDVITLNATLTASAVAVCSLCLASVEHSIDLRLEEAFSDMPGIDDAIWEFDGKIIDTSPAVLSAVLLNLPMKVLCSDDCKGLCPVCGENRNLSDCGCDVSSIDPRWLGLFEKEV